MLIHFFPPKKSGIYCFHKSKNYAYILHAGSNQTAFYRKERQSRDLELYQSFSSQPIESSETVQRRRMKFSRTQEEALEKVSHPWMDSPSPLKPVKTAQTGANHNKGQYLRWGALECGKGCAGSVPALLVTAVEICSSGFSCPGRSPFLSFLRPKRLVLTSPSLATALIACLKSDA